MDIFSLGPLVALAIALVPATFAYVRGRQVGRFADDPALPERLAAGRRVTSGTFAMAAAALLVLTASAAVWAIPLAGIAYVAAGLPARKILYGETWSLPAYLSFTIRSFVAGWSFWALVAAAPALALWAGERAWIVSAAMGAGLLVLGSRQTETILWLTRARPIADRAIRERFDRLVAASGIATPRFDVIELHGGSLANAFALPSLRRSAVVFTAPLIERLAADEADAICAHEIAHLEYFTPRRLRQRRLVTRSLIAAGALLTPPLQILMPSHVWFASALWPIVVLISIAVMVQDRQKHETASDLRAVALTGNPEALVRGLVKLHAMARVPRRWDADLERHQSHPSLKKRIQDIRAAAGTAPAALGEAAVFESADATARVVFADEGLEWTEGDSASFRVRYDRLKDLRVAAVRGGQTTLLAADPAGHRWQMPLRAEDVGRLQAVLDIVDGRTAAGSAPVVVWQPLLLRAATLTVFVVSLNAGLIAAAGVMALTLARPETPLLGAAGLAAVAGSILTWRDPGAAFGFIPEGYQSAFALALLAGGALLLWAAYSRRHEHVAPRIWALVGVIGAAAIASWLMPLGGRGVDALGLHQAAREWPAAVVLPVALAGAMMWSSRVVLRVAAALAITAGAAATVAGSQRFLDRYGVDLFLKPIADTKVRTLDRPVMEFALPYGVSGLQVSPNGRSIAALVQGPRNRPALHIGRAGETLTAIDADGALFVDDDRALVWTVDGSRTDLRQVRAASPETPDWQLRVTGIETPAVSLDPASRRWRLTSPGVGVVDTREGAIGSDRIASRQWRVPDGHPSPFIPVAVSGDRALAVEPRPDLTAPAIDPLGALVYVLASVPRWRSTIWALGPDGAADLGTSRLELECHRLPLADNGVCQIFDASRTRFFSMDAATRGITAVSAIPGRFFAGAEPQNSWITGWYQSGLIAVRLSRPDAIRLEGPNGSRAHMLAVSDHVAAGVWYEIPATAGLRIDAIYQQTGTSVVRLYSID